MKLSAFAKKTILIIGILFIVLVAAGIGYYRSLECLPFVFGAILGTALSVFKVIALERAIEKSIGMEASQAGKYIRFQHLFRLFLTGLLLYVAATVPMIDLWGTAAGIFTFQCAVLLMKYF